MDWAFFSYIVIFLDEFRVFLGISAESFCQIGGLLLETCLGSFHGDEGGFQKGALGCEASFKFLDLFIQALVLAADAVELNLKSAWA